MRTRPVYILGLVCASALGGCGPRYEPIYREGTWFPDHSNRTNLTMQVANPNDLVQGTGTTTSDGQLAAAAVERLRAGKVKRLQDSGVSQIQTSASGGDNSTPTTGSTP